MKSAIQKKIDIHGEWTTDGKSIFYGEMGPYEIADIRTFQFYPQPVVNGLPVIWYAKDSKYVYCFDASTLRFRTINSRSNAFFWPISDCYAKDKEYVYYKGIIQKEMDPESLIQMYPQANDPNTTPSIYVKDKEGIYCDVNYSQSVKVEACYDHFMSLFSMWGTDKNNLFMYGCAVEKSMIFTHEDQRVIMNDFINNNPQLTDYWWHNSN